MNNSFISQQVSLTLDDKVDYTEQLGIEESRITRIIEAVGRVTMSEDWSTLKSLIFDRRIESLEKQMMNESLKLTINDSELYRLQGKLYEARKYDLDNLVDSYRLELSKIRKLTSTKVETQPTER